MAKKVLIIDDDVEYVDAITNLLDARGYSVTSAHNGKDGVAAAKAGKPDLIILDVMMTTQSEGFDVARELHDDADLNSVPVVMITGVRKEMNLPFGFEPDSDWLPVKALLEKPVKPEVLLKTIEQHI
ncbi:MAG: response regulator [Phycisphaerae bacterium]|nr:response regulator [Phycisphaerae bacterium]